MVASEQLRMPSLLSLDENDAVNHGSSLAGSLPATGGRRQSYAGNLPSPSVHVPSISVRLTPPSSNGLYPSGLRAAHNGSIPAGFDRVLIPNGGIPGQRNGLARSLSMGLEEGEILNDASGAEEEIAALNGADRIKFLKRICSDGVLSADSGSSSGNHVGSYWMLVVTPVVSSFSVALVIAAVAGPQWLFTEEKLPNGNYNGTMNYNLRDDGIYLTKYTKSSLWMLCSKTGGGSLGPFPAEFQCGNIDYFPQEDYDPHPQDSTNAIPYTVTHSAPFFLASSLILVVSYVLFLQAMCSARQKICYFVSGVLFIITGLLMLIGLIMFISILKAEIGSKLRPRSSLQAPLFSFRYGQSFLLFVFGFAITELSGILNVLIYSNMHQRELKRAQTYPTYQSLGGNYCTVATVPCAVPKLTDSSNGFRTTRFYFEKPEKDCVVHRYGRNSSRNSSLVQSLNELYTEPAPEMRSTATAMSPPGVDDISAASRVEIVPGSGKLTRSVSTCTNIMVMDEELRNVKGAASDENLKNICGFSKQYLTKELSKEKLFNEFCKKVGPRPKPKNIYFIEDDGKNNDGFQNVFVIEGNNSDDDKFKRKRRNSMLEEGGRLSESLNQRQRIKSDNSLEQMSGGFKTSEEHLRNNYDLRQTLPRNFLKKNYNHFVERNVSDDRGGSNSLDDLATDNWNRRISASGLLEPVRLNSSQSNLASTSPHHNSAKWPKIIPKSSTDFLNMQQKYLPVPPSPSYVEYAIQRSPVQVHRSYGDLTMSPHYARIQQPITVFNYIPPPPPPGAGLQQRQFFGTGPNNSSPVFDLDKIESERRKSHSQLFLNSPGKATSAAMSLARQSQSQGQINGYDFINGTAV
ncbi:uncharacterized protein LOC129755851 [Uranotaenia lowii]|uniref:uncharacterized protein LOC129755851 n=1 Tax=Uranotaenia lowii TaxID=190385 RepID=UPI00247A9FA1|nr:uncharacterized protein LOC129755851 [Uranotaenia lowii]